jgi:hypothetical protein
MFLKMNTNTTERVPRWFVRYPHPCSGDELRDKKGGGVKAGIAFEGRRDTFN